MGKPYVFYWRNKDTGKTEHLAVDPEALRDPTHFNHKAIIAKYQEGVSRWGEPYKIDEPTIGGEGHKVSLPIGTGFIDVPAPEMKESTARAASSMVGQIAGAEAGGAAGLALGSLGGPAAPVTAPLGAILGTYFGGAAGHKGAQELQKSAGIPPDQMSPWEAGAWELGGGMAGSVATGGLRRLTRGRFAGTHNLQMLQRNRAAFERLGLKPSIMQVAETRGLLTSLQQLAMDMPILRGGVGRWVDESYEAVNRSMGQRGLNRYTRQEAGEALDLSLDAGFTAETARIGQIYDSFYDMLPQGEAQPVNIKSFVEALINSPTYNSEVLAQIARSGNDSARLLKKVVDQYATSNPIMGASGQILSTHHFADIPFREAQALRTELGRIINWMNPKGVADYEKAAMRGALTQDMQRAIETALPRKNLAGKGHRGMPEPTAAEEAQAMLQRADYEWKTLMDRKKDFLQKYMKQAAPAKLLKSLNTAINDGDISELRALKETILADEDLGRKAWRMTQDNLLSLASTTRGKFDLQKFTRWYKKMAQENSDVLDLVFGTESTMRGLIDDLVVASDAFWPMSRKQGQTFVQEQFERPWSVGKQLAGASAGGSVAGAGVMSGNATMTTVGALISAGFMFAPGTTSVLVRNPAFVKWLTKSARVGPESIGHHIGLLSSSVFNDMRNDERVALLRYMEGLQKAMGVSQALNAPQNNPFNELIQQGQGGGPLAPQGAAPQGRGAPLPPIRTQGGGR